MKYFKLDQIVKNIKNKLSYFPKAIKVGALTAVTVLVLAVATTSTFADWGPGRPVFDWNNPEDRKGSLEGPVFNSFINTPTYGDERNFVRVARANGVDNPQNANFTEEVTVTPGEQYWVRIFVHNNANESLNQSGQGVADDTRVRLAVGGDGGLANGIDVGGYITADNSTPGQVYDTGTFKNDNRAFKLVYVTNSTSIVNDAFPNGKTLPEGIMTGEGIQIGYDQMNGEFPGCFDYVAYVYAKVVVRAPELEIEKRVTTPGSTDWHENISAEVGDTVSWRVDYTNTGTARMDDLTIRDELPKGVKLVPESIKWYDENHSGEVLGDNSLGAGGINLGSYAPLGDDNGINGTLVFRTVITDDIESCTLRNVAFGRGNNVPETDDDATVTIEDCEEETPEFACSGLSYSKSGNKFTFKVTEDVDAGVNVQKYVFTINGDDFESNTPELTKTLDEDKKYTVTAKIVTDQGTTPVGSCKLTITPDSPEVPEELPQTGPAEAVMAVAGSGGLAAAARSWFASRKELIKASLK